MESDDSETCPLPPPPRCRGIPLGDGHYTGCAYGYGDAPPFTPPCDCPTCNGSGFEGPIGTTLPHADFGDLTAVDASAQSSTSRLKSPAMSAGR
jgi:hypothetical protein